MRKFLAGFAVTATVLVLSTANAYAVDTTVTTGAAKASRLVTVKSKCDTAVKQRLTKLDELKAKVNSSKYVTSDHKSGLLAEIAADESGLTALNSKIQADADLASATTDAKKIVVDYRVYVLEAPKVHEILAIDAIASVDTKLQTLSPALSRQLAEQKSKGVDVAGAESALADLNTKADAIGKTNGELAGPVLALQPSEYPGNKATIKSTRQALTSEAAQAKAARADVETLRVALPRTTAVTR